MLGLVFVAAWLVLFALLANRGANPIRLLRQKDGQVEVAGQRPRAAVLALAIAPVPFLFLTGNRCLVTVPAASVAAVYDPLRGGIQDDVLQEGFHVVLPWRTVQPFVAQTQSYTMSASQANDTGFSDGSIRCQTNEGMNVQIDCTVLFAISPSEADKLWQRVGEDYLKLLVRPYAHNVMRMVVAKYSVEDVYTTRRKQIESEITEQMRPLFAEKGLVLESVLLRNVQYGNPAFAEAINAKQVAQQQVQTEYQKLQRAQIEKQTIVAEAQGEARAIMRRGATLRENPEVVQYEFVQKVAPRLRSMYLPSGALPIPKEGR